MAFALVNFYEEEVWDVINSSDIILGDTDEEVKKGLKTLVRWRDIKTKGKGKITNVPAEIIKLSDDKKCLLQLLKEDPEDNDVAGIEGKGCRKRISNSKYVNEGDTEEEPELETTKVKRLKISSKKKEEATRSASFAKIIKEKYKKECDRNDDPKNGVSDQHYKKVIDTLEFKVKALQQENVRLREQIANNDDLKSSVKKLKRYINRLDETPTMLHEHMRASPSGTSLSWTSSVEPQSPASPAVSIASDLSSSKGKQLVEIPESPFSLEITEEIMVTKNEKPRADGDMIVLGAGLCLSPTVFKRIKPRKVGNYVANIMGAMLTREHMATHSYKGQKGKNGQVKPKLDADYTKSLIEHAKHAKYTDMPRQVIEEDVVKAIKFKLNNEEQAWKKQQVGQEKDSKPGVKTEEK